MSRIEDDPLWPKKWALREVQVAVGVGAQAVATTFGTVMVDAEGLLRAAYRGHHVDPGPC